MSNINCTCPVEVNDDTLTEEEIEQYRKERVKTIVEYMTTWRPQEAHYYYSGQRKPDLTTIAVAARANDLEFVKWAESSYPKTFDESTVMIYAWASENQEIIQIVEKLCSDVTISRAKFLWNQHNK